MSAAREKAAGVRETPAEDTTGGGSATLAKRAANLRARLALRGYAAHALTDGGWLVARWGLTRYCPTLDDLLRFAIQVGAAAP